MLKEADWRLVDDAETKANVLFETNVKINDPLVENFGDDFENCKNGYADFVLLGLLHNQKYCIIDITTAL